MIIEEETKTQQLALQALSFDDRLTFAKALKRAVENTDDPEEKRAYKTRIRELFTDEEWKELELKAKK